MNPEKWEKLNEIFHAALEIGADERDVFLEEACQKDEQLFKKVKKLLSAHQKSEDFIQKPVFENAIEILSDQEDSSIIGKNFGVYKIIGELGHGGMGAVYLAERTDSEFEKKAAIKIIKRGMDTEAVLRRFRNERQILASLEHPNIARLLDGGTTEDGLPYFVMEYIEGKPINEFADSHELSLNERLELFRQVCSAIGFAHQRLVVHRDIKPSNILVTEDGIPKLLDFGIAKFINPDRTGKETVPTATGLRLMTPEYASPEQIAGLQVTTLSDVYSLGVILYELLSGRSPYPLQESSLFEISSFIKTEEPPKPSERALETRKYKDADTQEDEKDKQNVRINTRKLPFSPVHLKGDLDNIVLKAMRKEPDQRYSSAEQFSEDIRRFLVGLPVTARPLDWKYRFAKFTKRNKITVGLFAVIIFTLIGGIITTTRQSIRANNEKELSEKRFNEVRRLVRTVLFDYHDAIKNLPGSTPIRERLVRDALQYLDGLSADAGNDRSLQLEIASAYERVGDVQGGTLASNLGDTKGAIESYRKALTILNSLESAESENDQVKIAASSCYRKFGSLLWESGDTEGALENNRKSLAILQKLLDKNPNDYDLRFELGTTYDRIGAILQEQGKLEEAMENFKKDLAILEGFSESEKQNESVRRSFSVVYEHIGLVQMESGQLESALENIRQAIIIRQALSKDFPLNTDYLRSLGVGYYNEGEILGRMNRYKDSLESYQKQVRISEELSAKDPQNKQYQDDLAYGLIRIGDMLFETGDLTNSLNNYRKSQEMRAADVKSDPGNLWKRASLIESHAKISKTLAKMGQNEAAKNESDQTFSLMEKTEVEPSNATIRNFFAETYINLAEAYSPKFPQKACQMYKQSLEILEDMKNRNILSDSDTKRLDLVKTEINNCKS